jgi:hypothetical protein
MRECERLIKEIKTGLERIQKADAQREARALGMEMFQAGKTNGHSHGDVNLALAALAQKGQTQ